jgi:hypothetical protein
VKSLHGWMLAILMAGAWPTQAGAKPQFSAYEGRDALQEGQGGTSITRNGVGYWTTGAPPRRYRIIGILTDTKCLGVKLCGDPVNRPATAETIKANGGEAAIVLGKSNDARGMVGGGAAYAGPRYTLGFGWSSAVVEHGTTMLIIKYLPDELRKP